MQLLIMNGIPAIMVIGFIMWVINELYQMPRAAKAGLNLVAAAIICGIIISQFGAVVLFSVALSIFCNAPKKKEDICAKEIATT